MRETQAFPLKPSTLRTLSQREREKERGLDRVCILQESQVSTSLTSQDSSAQAQPSVPSSSPTISSPLPLPPLHSWYNFYCSTLLSPHFVRYNSIHLSGHLVSEIGGAGCVLGLLLDGPLLPRQVS